MGRNYQKDDPIWRKAFGKTLKKIFVLYSLNYQDFCEKYHISESTVRYWMAGEKLPQLQFMKEIKEFISQTELDDITKTKDLQNYVAAFMCSQGAEEAFFVYKRRYPSGTSFAGEILTFYRDVAKHRTSLDVSLVVDATATGKTQAIVFDFDGTLTKNSQHCTIWEHSWMNLGYPKTQCQELYQRYNNKEISHAEWCKITEAKFKECHFHRDHIEKIVSKIHLLRNVRKTFKILSENGIKIYIVSGSIDIIIKKVLGNLNQYIEETKANYFKFDSNGFLIEIVGTHYDNLGKAYYISQIAEELNISPQDILFVGNSMNDRFAHRSGARTLCINPTLTDPFDKKVWNNCIQSCESLGEILAFL